MHRSGTSLTAQVLSTLGVDLGEPSSLLESDPVDNPDGYFEQEPIVDFNDALLGALGGHASEPPELPLGWQLSDELRPFAARARELIESLYSQDPWCMKDPRASLLLPFWRMVRADLRIVICVRNPLEVARSMERRGDPYPLEHWLQLWSRHTRSAIAGSAGADHFIVIYDELLASTGDTARILAEFALGAEAEESKVAAATRLPTDQYRRTHIRDAELLADRHVPSSISNEYFAVRELAHGRAKPGPSTGSIDSRP
jgi:hypothetical protein